MMFLPRTPLDVARKIIDVDLMGVFYAMRAQLPAFEKQFSRDGRDRRNRQCRLGGRRRRSPMLSVYAAAKHGVVGLTKSAAIEYARRGVRVNALCPVVRADADGTDFLDRAGKDREAAEAAMVQAIPMGRLAEVEEVIAGMIYLADPASSFVTGQTSAWQACEGQVGPLCRRL
jgi:NAD(P)-dependent dehydrogenase (short-subunit alcohol dehydrogenase family)